MDPSVFDPQTFDLGLILTAAGVPVAAGVIAAFIQVLKRIPFIGAALSTQNGARTANIGLCAVIVGWAAAATHVELTLVSGFMLFLAWLNLVGFTDKAYEIAPDGVKEAIGGTTKP